MDIPKTLGNSGTLPAAGTAAALIGPGTPPFTLQLTSTNATRGFTISADGVNFVPLAPTSTTAGSILAAFNGPLAQVQFAGNAGDPYVVL